MRKLVTVYEDGTRHECDAQTWLDANDNDPDLTEVYYQLLAGLTVTLGGGGAQPLCRMLIENQYPGGMVGSVPRFNRANVAYVEASNKRQL